MKTTNICQFGASNLKGRFGILTLLALDTQKEHSANVCADLFILWCFSLGEGDLVSCHLFVFAD